MRNSPLEIYIQGLLTDFPKLGEVVKNILALSKLENRVTLVCGGRDFKDKKLLFETLDEMEIHCIVHGGATGADQCAGEWAIMRRIPEVIVPAQWSGFGKSAGPVRNQWMIDFVKVNQVVAFPGGRRTQNMISQAEQNNIPVVLIKSPYE